MEKVLVIIPAYNEEGAIENVIKSVRETVAFADILVVNDGSKDNTSSIARENGASVVDLPYNLGIGGAMQTGYLYAYKNNYDVAIQLDGDGQHNPIYIPDMLEQLKENDMVIGSRYKETTGYRSTFFRRFGMLIFSFLLLVFSGRKFSDTTSGFRAVNKKVIKFFALNYPTDYPEVEVLIRLCKLKYKICEISVEMEERKTGTSFVTPIRSVYYMIKVTLGIIVSSMRSERYYN